MKVFFSGVVTEMTPVFERRADQMLRRMFANGAWYYTVTIATVGLFAWVAFLHAAINLDHSSRVRRRVVQYGVCAVAIAVLSGVTPTDRQGNPRGTVGGLLSTVVAVGALVVIVMACVQLRPLRRAVYGPTEPAKVAPGVDPAVATALANRRRREDARALAERDPNLARDLNMGRPDRAREYDDGGLIDINSAPAAVFVTVCGIDREAAERLVTTREHYPSGFTSVQEVLAYVDLSERDADVLRDRGLVLPS